MSVQGSSPDISNAMDMFLSVHEALKNDPEKDRRVEGGVFGLEVGDLRRYFNEAIKNRVQEVHDKFDNTALAKCAGSDKVGPLLSNLSLPISEVNISNVQKLFVELDNGMKNDPRWNQFWQDNKPKGLSDKEANKIQETILMAYRFKVLQMVTKQMLQEKKIDAKQFGDLNFIIQVMNGSQLKLVTNEVNSTTLSGAISEHLASTQYGNRIQPDEFNQYMKTKAELPDDKMASYFGAQIANQAYQKAMEDKAKDQAFLDQGVKDAINNIHNYELAVDLVSLGGNRTFLDEEMKKPEAKEALKTAIANGNKELTTKMLAFGADPNIKTTDYKRNFGQRLKDVFKKKGGGLKALFKAPERSLKEIASLDGNQQLANAIETAEKQKTISKEEQRDISPELQVKVKYLSSSMSLKSQDRGLGDESGHSLLGRESMLFSSDLSGQSFSSNSNGIEHKKDYLIHIEQRLTEISTNPEYNGLEGQRTALQDQLRFEEKALGKIKDCIGKNPEKLDKVIDSILKESNENKSMLSDQCLSEPVNDLLKNMKDREPIGLQVEEPKSKSAMRSSGR